MNTRVRRRGSLPQERFEDLDRHRTGKKRWLTRKASLVSKQSLGSGIDQHDSAGCVRDDDPIGHRIQHLAVLPLDRFTDQPKRLIVSIRPRMVVSRFVYHRIPFSAYVSQQSTLPAPSTTFSLASTAKAIPMRSRLASRKRGYR